PGADPAAGGLGGALLGAGPDPAYRQDPASRIKVRGLSSRAAAAMSGALIHLQSSEHNARHEHAAPHPLRGSSLALAAAAHRPAAGARAGVRGLGPGDALARGGEAAV